MKTLMEVCQNWGAEGCHSDISKWKSIKVDREGIQLHPLKEKVDKICKNCFDFSPQECPECGSRNTIEMTRFNPEKSPGPTYACKNCDFSFTKTRMI